MTYEVAGGGRGGLAVDVPGSGVLTLADRIARHLTTSLTTFATAVANRQRLLERFVDARTPSGPAATYLWSADQPEATGLAETLARHGIVVDRLAAPAQVDARPFLGGDKRAVRFAGGTWAVSTDQPLGTLARTLMERQATMPAPFLEKQRSRVTENLQAEFYDITAWALPLAYNLEVWTAEGVPPGLEAAAPSSAGGVSGEPGVGYVMAPQGLAGYRFAAALEKHDIPFRLATEGFRVGERPYGAGTLFVPLRPGDEAATTVAELARNSGVSVEGVGSSLTAGGIPLGSNRMLPVRRAHIGLLLGDGLDSTSVGFVWSLLDRAVGADYTLLDIGTLRGLRLSQFDVLILPDGQGYDRVLGDKGAESLHGWVQNGGVLVGIGGAVDWLRDQELVKLQTRPATPDDSSAAGSGASAAATDQESKVWSTELQTPGAIVATNVVSSPLTAGVASAPPMLFWGDTFYEPTGDPQQDLLTVRHEDPILAGEAWPEARENLAGSLLEATLAEGDGRYVLITQEPDFRMFWRGTMPLLLNAALFGPSLQGGAGY